MEAIITESLEEELERPSSFFATRLFGRLSLRDLLTLAGFVYMLLTYQFSMKAQLDTNTIKIEQIDTHLANTDKIIADEMVPRKEHDAANQQQIQRDTLQEQQIQALQQDFMHYLMGTK